MNQLFFTSCHHLLCGHRHQRRIQRAQSGSSGQTICYDPIKSYCTELSETACRDPMKPYCTQACLSGLKRDWNLDENCPNVQWHRTSESGNRHPLDVHLFTQLVKLQLDHDPYNYCVCLSGVTALKGRMGLLFKLELSQYGDTFVAKGSRRKHPRNLEHEGHIYNHLDNLQGDIVPVDLGLVHLEKGYLPIGEYMVWYMVLMLWAGDDFWSDKVSGVEDKQFECERSLTMLRFAGVEHGDTRIPNLSWSKERGRVMIIDFDLAEIIPNSEGE